MGAGLTPGPWAYCPDIGRVYSLATDAMVASVPNRNNPLSEAQWPTDARAIAALPDVLEALRDARDNGLIYWEPQSARGVEQKALMLARIDAALAKATGDEY